MPCVSPDLLEPSPVSCKPLKRRGPCGWPECNQFLAACMCCTRVQDEYEDVCITFAAIRYSDGYEVSWSMVVVGGRG